MSGLKFVGLTCNVGVWCIRTSKIERNISLGSNFGNTTFIPPSDAGNQLLEGKCLEIRDYLAGIKCIWG